MNFKYTYVCIELRFLIFLKHMQLFMMR